MAESQPSELHEGAADPHAPTGTAEDRKAAAALSSLDAQDDGSEKKDVDSNALSHAIKGLSVQAQKGEVKKSVKVEVADVALLMSELELSKPKATELLRSHEGNAVEAMAAYITTSV